MLVLESEEMGAKVRHLMMESSTDNLTKLAQRDHLSKCRSGDLQTHSREFSCS